MKPKVALIGRGKWGLVLERTLLEVIQTDFVEPEEAEWIFLATPNDLHYDQVKYWLNQKKNKLAITYDEHASLIRSQLKNNKPEFWEGDIYSKETIIDIIKKKKWGD